MFDCAPPQKTANEAIADSLKPRTENVAYAPDATDSAGYNAPEDTLTWNAAVELLGGGPGYNPAFCGSAKYKGLEVAEFTDLGYVGDPQRNGNMGRQFSETHAYFGNFRVKPAAQLDLVYDWNSLELVSKAARAGIAVPVKIGRNANMLLECYPLSTNNNGEGKMENEAILSGSAKMGKGISVYGMGRFFNTGKDFTPLGKVGFSYDMNGKWSAKAEYRNWPKVVSGKKSRDSSIYIGFARRFASSKR